eukprot:g16807.t1
MLRTVFGSSISSLTSKKTQLNIAKDPAVFNATPDPKQVAEYLRGTKSSGLKAVLRNEFEKIGRARITLGQIAEELREYRAKNIVGKAEPAGGWGDLKDPDTNKKIICTSRGEYNLEVRRCVAAAKIKKSGKACKNYLVAILTKMKIENKEKQQEKIIEKAKKREKELAMIKPEGAMMKGKVKIFADALKLSGDSGSWSSETLATKIDAGIALLRLLIANTARLIELVRTIQMLLLQSAGSLLVLNINIKYRKFQSKQGC